MSNHIPMCPVCNENEVGAFLGSDQFCSPTCEHTANVEEAEKERYDMMMSGSYDDFLSQYDDDPSPYAGTYSEE
jgi:hypothetical protein